LARAPESTSDLEQEERFYRSKGEEATRRRALADDDDEPKSKKAEEPFLRGKKRVPVRKAGLRKGAIQILIGGAVLFAVVVLGLAGYTLRQYAMHARRFLIETSDNIETGPLKNVARSQVLEVFGGDIGRNIFYVDLAKRREQLQKVSWIESATVMRFLPNRLRVEVKERTPVAFAQVGGTTGLIDSRGVLMEMPHSAESFSFPVITGLSFSDPLNVRAQRMKSYAQLIQELDANNAHYSADVSEVALDDPQDLKIVVGDGSGTVLVHLGNTDFQRRYRFYLEHINTWRQQYQVRSVDLRYEGQVIVNREGQATEK
jgi:cell division protein FtsQ